MYKRKLLQEGKEIIDFNYMSPQQFAASQMRLKGEPLPKNRGRKSIQNPEEEVIDDSDLSEPNELEIDTKKTLFSDQKVADSKPVKSGFFVHKIEKNKLSSPPKQLKQVFSIKSTRPTSSKEFKEDEILSKSLHVKNWKSGPKGQYKKV